MQLSLCNAAWHKLLPTILSKICLRGRVASRILSGRHCLHENFELMLSCFEGLHKIMISIFSKGHACSCCQVCGLALQADVGTDLDCLLTLDNETVAMLGAGPFCRFKAPMMLSVTLGSGASIMPAATATPHTIRLAGGAIGSADGQSHCHSCVCVRVCARALAVMLYTRLHLIFGTIMVNVQV